MSLYGGSRAAIRQFVRTWMRDLKDSGRGIRINVLSPGAVDTPSLRAALEGASGADKVQALVDEMGAGNPTRPRGGSARNGESCGLPVQRRVELRRRDRVFVDGGLAQTG